MDWILSSQASEVFLPAILEEEVGVEWVDLLDGHVVGAGGVAALLRHFHLGGDHVGVEDLTCLFGHVGHRGALSSDLQCNRVLGGSSRPARRGYAPP